MVLPKDLVKLVPKTHLMSEDEWRGIGVQQSKGWIHYMTHQPGIYMWNQYLTYIGYMNRSWFYLFTGLGLNSIVCTPMYRLQSHKCNMYWVRQVNFLFLKNCCSVWGYSSRAEVVVFESGFFKSEVLSPIPHQSPLFCRRVNKTNVLWNQTLAVSYRKAT